MYSIQVSNLEHMMRFWNNHSSATLKVEILESQIIFKTLWERETQGA
jgi:hypothetical protein